MRTGGRQRTILRALDTLLREHRISMDEFCEVLSSAWMDEADNIDATLSNGDAAAKSALQSASSHISQAGMDWYVSTK